MNDGNKQDRNYQYRVTPRDPKHFVGHDIKHHYQPRRVRRFLGRMSSKQRTIGLIVLTVVSVSAFMLFQHATFSFLAEVPTSGGRVVEGGIGSARFINPVLAISPVDKDLVSLVYAGLMRPSSDGLALGLAESFTVSDDGLTYRFTLRQDAQFHDGEPVTAEDVAFTIELVQHESLKSPQFVHWENVVVEINNEHEVSFRIPEPYSPFMNNTTLGILPKHIWDGIARDEIPFSEHNVSPIGAGPFEVQRVRKDQGGIPQIYELRRFNDYILGRPYLTAFHMRLFRDEESALTAYRAGEIDSLAGVSPALIHDDVVRTDLATTPLPRVFGVFYNSNRATVFTRSEVRETLELLTDRESVIERALFGFGSPLDTPLPLTEESLYQIATNDTPRSKNERFARAEEILTDAGWERSEEDGVWELTTDDETLRFAFELATAQMPELVAAADQLETQWREFGIDVTVSTQEVGELTQSTIRPRRFDALLFGMILGRESDLYAFWHSSQRTDPGLNIAQYTSINADKLLEAARLESDRSKQEEAYVAFTRELHEDKPALFLYQPHLLYLPPRHVHNIILAGVADAHERFSSIHEWYSDTRRIWKGFSE